MFQSWGKIHKSRGDPDFINNLKDNKCITANNNKTFFGMGRSYGDVAINNTGKLVCTHNLNRFISFDKKKGILRAESGVTLDQILELIIPYGWFLSVTPGSKFVTLGGAIANDVHGKNHHLAGSFGAYVNYISLKRSDGKSQILSRENNNKLFSLTISGMGLTGFIEWAEIRLKKIKSSNMIVENIKINSLDDFFTKSEASNNWEYTAAWIDCFAPEKKIGRGVFTRANFADDNFFEFYKTNKNIRIPFNFPQLILNKYLIKIFNYFYMFKQLQQKNTINSYELVHYPLDRIKEWNKIYGSKGFYQHQSIIPKEKSYETIKKLLHTINESGQGSFLCVLKNHAYEKSPGLNSFCMEGTSLALDFANKGKKTLRLLQKLDEIVTDSNGRMYPAKDGVMTSTTYKSGYPNWKDLEKNKDPKVSSSFWERVMDLN